MSYETILATSDLETGGLNTRLPNGKMGSEWYPIFEIALVLCNAKLERIGEPLHIVIHQDEDAIARSHEQALQMHEKSGLLAKVRESKITLREAEKMVIDYLENAGVVHFGRDLPDDVKIGVLTNNNVSFDHSFIRAQMPAVANFLHYNTIDVSTLRHVAKLFLGVDQLVGKMYNHRALDDVGETLRELEAFKGILQGTIASPSFSGEGKHEF